MSASNGYLAIACPPVEAPPHGRGPRVGGEVARQVYTPGRSATNTMPTRVCPSCGEARPAEHAFCFACGRALGPAVVPANTRRFRQRGLGMGYSRIVTRQDRLGEAAARTWGDVVARWYFTLSLLGAAVLWASSRGWLPAGWWVWVRAALLARLGG